MENVSTRLCLPGYHHAIEVINSLRSSYAAEDEFAARIANIVKNPDIDSAVPAGFVQIPQKPDQVTISRIRRQLMHDMPWLTTDVLMEIYAEFIACNPYEQERLVCEAIGNPAIAPEWWGKNDDGSEEQMKALFTDGVNAANEAPHLTSYDVTLLPGLKFAMRLCGHSVFGGSKDDMLSDISNKIDEANRMPANADEAFVLMPITAVYGGIDEQVQLAMMRRAYQISSDDLIDIYAMFIDRRPYAPMIGDVSGQVFIDGWDKKYENADWGHRPSAMAYFADGWYAAMRTRRQQAMESKTQ